MAKKFILAVVVVLIVLFLVWRDYNPILENNSEPPVISKTMKADIATTVAVSVPPAEQQVEKPVLPAVEVSPDNGVAGKTGDWQERPYVSTVKFVPEYAGNKGGIKVFADGIFRTFDVYTEAKSKANHFIPSGWMGDYSDLKITDKFSDNPHSGFSCIKIDYSNKSTQGARWAGIYWQNPANNWGSRPGGYDLTGSTKVTFWARGAKGGERIEEFKVGGISGDYPDSDSANLGPVLLTDQWQQFTIDLAGKDMSSISGGFCWVANLDGNPDGCTFYLDDIQYE